MKWLREHPVCTSLGFVFLYLKVLAPVMRLLIMTPLTSTQLTFICDLVMTMLCVWYLRKQGGLDLRLAHRPDWRILAFAGLCFVGTFLFGNIAGTVIYELTDDAAYTNYSLNAESDQMLTAVLAVTLAPLCEELLMRGVGFGLVQKKHSTVFAAMYSAVMFAFLHGTMTHLPLTLCLGMLSCALYTWTGSLLPSIVCHAALNACTQWVLPTMRVPLWLVTPGWALFGTVVAFATGLALVVLHQRCDNDEVDVIVSIDEEEGEHERLE